VPTLTVPLVLVTMMVCARMLHEATLRGRRRALILH
jgi:hypothetical protein